MADIINLDVISYLSSDNYLNIYLNSTIQGHFTSKKIYHLLWHIFHSFSVLYPENPNEIQQKQIKEFILNIKSNLKFICSSCSGIKDNFIQNYDLDLAVTSRDNLIQFFCDYHIHVNTNIRKQYNTYDSTIFNKEFIINRYINNDYISIIETKYDINLFNLFKTNQLDTFFTKFNDIKNNMYKEKITYKFQFNSD